MRLSMVRRVPRASSSEYTTCDCPSTCRIAGRRTGLARGAQATTPQRRVDASVSEMPLSLLRTVRPAAGRPPFRARRTKETKNERRRYLDQEATVIEAARHCLHAHAAQGQAHGHGAAAHHVDGVLDACTWERRSLVFLPHFTLTWVFCETAVSILSPAASGACNSKSDTTHVL